MGLFLFSHKKEGRRPSIPLGGLELFNYWSFWHLSCLFFTEKEIQTKSGLADIFDLTMIIKGISFDEMFDGQCWNEMDDGPDLSNLCESQ